MTIRRLRRERCRKRPLLMSGQARSTRRARPLENCTTAIRTTPAGNSYSLERTRLACWLRLAATFETLSTVVLHSHSQNFDGQRREKFLGIGNLQNGPGQMRGQKAGVG